MFEDKVLICRDCGREFTFTAGEQEFYAEKGFQNEPVRCRECRNNRKNASRNENREMYDAVCAECGAPTKVPFLPRNDKPIYCSACFANLVRALYASGYGRDVDIRIGQGFQGQTFDGVGIGRCCKGASHCVMGCPPTAEQIANALEDLAWQ
jgi:CxxC-x17-CxxC domain-containing protein